MTKSPHDPAPSKKRESARALGADKDYTGESEKRFLDPAGPRNGRTDAIERATKGSDRTKADADGTADGVWWTQVAIGLGSNLAPRLEHLTAGARALSALLGEPVFSAVYDTEPLHLRDQPRFLNACCVGRTTLAPQALLDRLHEIEGSRGRRSGPRYGPRELDLDILLYGDEVVRSATLRIPHPRLVERAFALIPLAEVAGGWTHPVTGVTVAELAARIDGAGVEATNLQVLGGGSG